MKKQIKITLGKKELKVDYKTKAMDCLLSLGYKKNDILGVKINNEVKEVDYELVKDSNIEIIDYTSADGYRVYSRTVKMVLYMALMKLYGNAKVNFITTIDKNQFFIFKDMIITEEEVEKIKNKMLEIISSNLDITKKTVPLEEAEVLYTESNDVSKLDNISNKLRTSVSMYFCDGFYNYFYGLTSHNTGIIKSFDLIKHENGAIIVFPEALNSGYDLDYTVDEVKLYKSYIYYNELNEKFGVENIGHLNSKVLDEDINSLIQSSEAVHNRKIVEIVQDIEKRKDVKMILIAGPTSSGKTTFAQKLGVDLTLIGYNPITISMDNYFKERVETPKDADGKYNFETVDALEIDLFNDHIKKLTTGYEVEMPEFNFLEGKKEYNGNYLKLKDNDILIVEGIHALNPMLTEILEDSKKYRIYIAPIATLNLDNFTKVSSSDTRLLRRIVRDYNTRGHSVERTMELWKKVKIGEEKYIFPYIETVDSMFNSSLIYEPGVIKTFVQPLLLQVDRTSKYYAEARRLYLYLNNYLTVETTNIPVNSIVREFIGNGCFYR